MLVTILQEERFTLSRYGRAFVRVRGGTALEASGKGGSH
jgi:hypothetical protein